MTEITPETKEKESKVYSSKGYGYEANADNMGEKKKAEVGNGVYNILLQISFLTFKQPICYDYLLNFACAQFRYLFVIRYI